MDWLVRLQQVMEAKNKGLIDEDEYRLKRAALIAGMEAEVTGTVSDSEDDSESDALAEPSELVDAGPVLMIDEKPIGYRADAFAALPEGAVFLLRYRIESKLRQTDHLVVYRVFDIQDQIPCELHLYRHLDEDGVNAVEREHAIGFRSRNAHLPQAIFSDLNAEPPYRITAFVPGISLRDKLSLRAGNVSFAEALTIMWALLDGVEHLHRAQIAHLDLRPETILLTRQGDLSLRDFGIESRLYPNLEQHQLSPEQRNGDVGDVKSDIYAIGMVFLRLVKGALPVEPTDEARFETWLEATPNIDVPEAVLAVIKTALSTNSDTRYEHATAMKKALQSATYKRGWMVLPASVVEEVAAKCNKDRMLLLGKTVSVQDSLGLLEQGSAWPSSRVYGGQILLESDSCAMAASGTPVPSDNDALTLAYMAALTDPTDFEAALVELEPMSARMACRAAKAAFALGEEALALSVAQKTDPKTSAEWLDLSDVWHSCFDDDAEAALSLDRAAQSASLSNEHIAIAAYIRWTAGDLRRTELVMSRAFEAAVHFDDWLAIAEAYLALLSDEQNTKVAIGRAMTLLEDESVIDQANKAALAGERLGASPAVIRWGISLEQKAQNSREMLAVESMWRQMDLTDRAVPLADRRQLRLSQELTRLRSQLVPLEIQLPLPNPPFDEYIVESYATQVQEQQKLHALAMKITNESALFFPSHSPLRKPYVQSDITERQLWLEKQLDYAAKAEEIVERANAIGWACPEIAAPRNMEQIQQATEAICFQEDLQQEFVRLWPHIDLLELPSFPRTVSDLDFVKSQLDEETFLSRLSEIAIKAKNVMWSPPKQSLPLTSEKLLALNQMLNEHTVVYEDWVTVREKALAIGWILKYPPLPLDADYVVEMSGKVKEQEIWHETLQNLNAISETIGLEQTEIAFPMTEETLLHAKEHIDAQNRFYESLHVERNRIFSVVDWAPKLPEMPCDESDVQLYKASVEKQLAHGHKLLRTYEKWPKSTKKRFPLPDPPYTQLIVRAHIEVVGHQLRQLRRRQLILALTVLAVIGFLLAIRLLRG